MRRFRPFVLATLGLVALLGGDLLLARVDPLPAVVLPPTPYDPLLVEEDVTVDGYQGSRFTWHDREGRPRTAVMVRNDRSDPAGHHGGYLRQYTYQLEGSTRTVDGRDPRHPGFGFVVLHFGNTGTTNHHLTGTFGGLLRGRHHAIHQYRWRMNAGGPMDVTVQWFFATGRDHPVYAITYDCSPAGPNVIDADTRSPYGDMHWDGGLNGDVAGVGWGDRYRFRSLGDPITLGNGWDYSQPNLIPHVLEYSSTVDAEMGLVQTQTYHQHDAGGYWFYTAWGQTDPDGPMPEDWNWTYQLNQYELPWGSDSKRLAWGANYGAVGQTSYLAYGDDRTLVGYPYQSYSVFVVLDRHSRAAVDAQVADMETIQGLDLSASLGSVARSGIAGVGRTDTVAYDLPGYNPLYSVWELIADASSQSAFRFSLAAGTVTNPIFVIRGYTAPAAPDVITVDGATALADEDYYASLDDANDRLWITLKGDFTGDTDVAVSPDATPLPGLSVSSPSVTEGDSGTRTLTFEVTLDPGS